MTTPTPQAPPGWYADASTGRIRWWDGNGWTDAYQSAPAAPVFVGTAARVTNYAATASLVLGVFGFVFMAVPFFIGWFLGGIPDVLAITFGIIGLNNNGARHRVGRPLAVIGIVFAGVSLLTVFIGAGSIW